MITTLHTHLVRGLTAVGFLSLLAIAACGDDSPSGVSDTESSPDTESPPDTESSPHAPDLLIHYTFPPGVSCDEHQETVENILVNVGENGIAGSRSAACDNAGGEIGLSGVALGSYDLFVLGIDDEGTLVLDNRGLDPNDERVEIDGLTEEVVYVELGLAPARIEVRLTVTIGDVAVECASNDVLVKGVRIEAWSAVSASLLKRHELDLCDVTEFQEVPDMARQLIGRHLDTIRLQPLDATGGPIRSLIELPLGGPVGAGKTVQVDIVCEGDVCAAEVL